MPSFAGTAGWLAPHVADLLKLLPGPVWHINQVDAAAAAAAPSHAAATAATLDVHKVVLAVFVGGVTLSGLVCLRFISERAPVDFVVLVSTVTSSNKILQQLALPEDRA